MNGANCPTIKEALRSIRAGDLLPEELWTACLAQVTRLNPRLRAFITINPEIEAATTASHKSNVQRARSAAASAVGALANIPLAIKDLIETANLRTTAGSLFFNDYVPMDDAAVVHKIKACGGVVLGKTNTHEIALGVTTQNPHFGSCRNPWDESRIPGGSSGGSAVAVATGMALAGLGTDTGGSIRIPASLCGVVGLKPTYGRVSVRGVFPLSWNLDHVGPLANTVEDAALLLGAIAGYDAEDPWSIDRPVEDYATGLEGGVKAWRIALGTGSYIGAAMPEVIEAVRLAGHLLAGQGAVIEEADVSFLWDAALANGIMTQADGAAYHRDRLAQHPEWFGDDVRKRLEAGRDTGSTDYSLARRTQSQMKRRMDIFFQSFDILLLPATPITASLAKGEDAVEKARQLTRFTAPFNLTGLPAISIPCGLSTEGLPIGLQMVTRPWQEPQLLQAARAYEMATGAQPLRPPLAAS